MLEIHDATGAFEAIEAYLRAHGFLADGGAAAAGRRADLLLGYGLSVTQRRTEGGVPPEPVPLPLAACRIRDADEPSRVGGAFEVGPWTATWDASSYGRAVELAREAIAAGEIYQVNLVQHLSAPFGGDPDGLAGAFTGFDPLMPRALHGDGWSIVSASPELFLSRRGARVRTMPIKGTRPLGGDAALRDSAKDAAEHVMIVDLERNDLGRICEPGSVRWPSLMVARELAGVVHLVSVVEGELRPDVGWAEAVAALFPGGSVTGAPKIAAIDHIAAIEPVGRGAAMGALGTVWPNGDLELALTIRTFAIADGRIHLWVGGGIVWDSQPSAEIAESWVKARPLLDAIDAFGDGGRAVTWTRMATAMIG
jgi:para-aminobenzoate synthetase component I